MENFKRMLNKTSVRWALGVLMFFYALAILASWIAPYDYTDEDRNLSYAPPTSIQWQKQGQWQRPFVYGMEFRFNEFHQRVFINKNVIYEIEFFKHGKFFSVAKPGRLYLLGADSRGRDIFSRLCYGARISLSIGLLGACLTFALGLFIGALSGYVGGWIDKGIMRLTEMMMLAPAFYLMLAIRAALPQNMSTVQVYMMVVCILSFLGWASLARVIRGMTLTVRQQPFVEAARLMGASHARIIIFHVIPQTASYALIAISFMIPSYILAEAGLSLLGLGIQDPVPSWGNMLAESMQIVIIRFSPWILWPGICILMVVMACQHLGEALRDALDPRYGR